MVPPRIQCLNASRHISKKPLTLIAPSSTSQARRAYNGSPRQSPANVLASLDGHTSPSSPSAPIREFSKPYTPSQANVRNGPRAEPSSGFGHSVAATSIQRLIAKSHQKNNARAAERRSGQLSRGSAELVANDKLGRDLSRQITRRWKQGDVYAPHDLSAVEMAKWKKMGRPTYDAFDMLDFKPQDAYRNFSIMSEYMTEMGRIKHSRETGLRPVNQRRIARAIRRSIGTGLMPSVYRHPEILQKIRMRNEQLSPITKGPM